MVRRRQAEPSLIEAVVQGQWQVAASFAGLLFVFIVIVPALVRGNAILANVFGTLRPLLWIGFFACCVLALVKYLIAQRQESKRRVEEYFAKDDMQRHLGRIFEGVRSQDQRIEPVLRVVEDGKPQAWSLDVLRDMEWKRFEDFCAELYRVKGIQCETTSLGADGGVDIRLYNDTPEGRQCGAIVQCKAWGERDVGVRLIRELRGVMAHEKLDKGFFMAPGGYTADARAFADANNIRLYDGDFLLTLIRQLSAASQLRLLAFATEGDWTTPTCPHCGVKMLAREGAGYRFWGCRHYPRCRQRINMRADA